MPFSNSHRKQIFMSNSTNNKNNKIHQKIRPPRFLQRILKMSNKEIMNWQIPQSPIRGQISTIPPIQVKLSISEF